MELHRDRHWFDDDCTRFPSTSYERDQSLWPKQVIAEYYAADTVKVVSHWTSDHTEAHSPETQLQPSSNFPIYDPSALVWVAAHSDELYRRYPNQWILVDGNTVVEHSDDPLDLMALAEKRGITVPFITRVAPPSKSHRMLYGG
jgi:hypothetical protein